MSITGIFPVAFIVAPSVFLFILIFKIFHSQWWVPTRLQKRMGLQGIKGPSYRLVHGNSKEILNMKKEAVRGFKGLSHDVFPLLQPEHHSWLKTYGMFPFLTHAYFVPIHNPYCSELFKTSDEIEAEKLEKEIRETVLEIVKKRENKALVPDGHKDFGEDFLGALLKAHHDDDVTHESKDKCGISMDDIIDQCKALYFAAQETSNGSLPWTMFLLAIHRDWQEEARKEVLQVLGNQNPTLDGLSRLKTMNMIVNEALRLYPPVTQLAKKPEREVRLENLIIPANINLFIPIIALHHDLQIWGKDASLFKPERFSEGVAKATNNNMAGFIPFGMGPRICVGFNFATTEIKIVLAMILQSYAFTLSPGYVHSPIQVLTLRPQKGVQVILYRL